MSVAPAHIRSVRTLSRIIHQQLCFRVARCFWAALGQADGRDCAREDWQAGLAALQRLRGVQQPALRRLLAPLLHHRDDGERGLRLADPGLALRRGPVEGEPLDRASVPPVSARRRRWTADVVRLSFEKYDIVLLSPARGSGKCTAGRTLVVCAVVCGSIRLPWGHVGPDRMSFCMRMISQLQEFTRSPSWRRRLENGG